MSTEESKAIMLRVFEEVLNQRNLALVDELYAPNFVYHTPVGLIHGPEGFKQFVMLNRTTFPDVHYTFEDMVVEGDEVVIRWTMRGTHLGPHMSIPPTGKQATVTGIVIGRLVDSKIVEGWVEFDALGMLQQFGVLPSMG